MKDGEILLGINGGHLHSSARAYIAGEERVLALPDGEPLDVHAHAVSSSTPHDLRLRLKAYATQIASELKISRERLNKQIRKVVVAFPGACLPSEQEDAERLVLSEFRGVPHRVVDDTWAGLFSELLTEEGICAFAGAGAAVSISIGGFRPNKDYKIDGLGPLLGDFGSGFQLVASFFRILGRRYDMGIPMPLFEEVQSYCRHALLPEIESVESLPNWFDGLIEHHSKDWRRIFATLAAPILTVADKTNSTPASNDARPLVVGCARQMSRSINIALKRAERVQGDLKIVLQGGMFRNSHLYTKIVKDSLNVDSSRLVVAQRRPADGALFLACDDQNLVNRLRQLKVVIVNHNSPSAVHAGN